MKKLLILLIKLLLWFECEDSMEDLFGLILARSPVLWCSTDSLLSTFWDTFSFVVYKILFNSFCVSVFLVFSTSGQGLNVSLLILCTVSLVLMESIDLSEHPNSYCVFVATFGFFSLTGLTRTRSGRPIDIIFNSHASKSFL